MQHQYSFNYTPSKSFMDWLEKRAPHTWAGLVEKNNSGDPEVPIVITAYLDEFCRPIRFMLSFNIDKTDKIAKELDRTPTEDCVLVTDDHPDMLGTEATKPTRDHRFTYLPLSSIYRIEALRNVRFPVIITGREAFLVRFTTLDGIKFSKDVDELAVMGMKEIADWADEVEHPEKEKAKASWKAKRKKELLAVPKMAAVAEFKSDWPEYSSLEPECLPDPPPEAGKPEDPTVNKSTTDTIADFIRKTAQDGDIPLDVDKPISAITVNRDTEISRRKDPYGYTWVGIGDDPEEIAMKQLMNLYVVVKRAKDDIFGWYGGTNGLRIMGT